MKRTKLTKASEVYAALLAGKRVAFQDTDGEAAAVEISEETGFLVAQGSTMLRCFSFPGREWFVDRVEQFLKEPS